MKHIAIEYKEISIGYNKYVYKPIRVVEGDYDEEQSIFTDKNGKIYHTFTTGEVVKPPIVASIVEREDYINRFSRDAKIAYKMLLYANNADGFILGRKINDVLATAMVSMTMDNVRDAIELGCKLKESSMKEEQDDSSIGEAALDIETAIQQVCDEELDDIQQKIISLKELRDKVNASIISQEEAVRAVTTTILTNFRSKNPRHKSHILIAGPSGTGKTEMVKIICKELGVPYYKVCATDYTQEGYVGASIDSMIEGLINTCGDDVNLAEHGILVVDEIDKKSSQNPLETISSKGVQDSLLKITGRDVIQVRLRADTPYEETINFDTSNLTVIFMGAFDGIIKKDNKMGIGFNSIREGATKYIQLEKENFIKDGGMTPELMGRIDCLVATNELNKVDYVKIMKESNISALKLEEEFLNENGIDEIEIQDDYIDEIAVKTEKSGVGARGIKSAISTSLEDIRERVLNGEKIKKIKLSRATAMNPKEYYFE